MSDVSVFKVSDMTCGHCVGTVRKALEQAFPGAEVNVDLDTHKVVVEGERKKAEQAIRDAGYTPEVV
jgi:copper chaperone